MGDTILYRKGYNMENRGYVIVTDSTTDMGMDYFRENEISVLRLHYTIDGEEYIQYTEGALTIKEFYDRVRKGSMPKTSQASYDDAFTIFSSFAEAGKDIFCLCFSSALSGSYQTVNMAAQDITEKYPDCKIRVVDSISACGGEGYLLDKCVKKRDCGASLDEVADYAEELKFKVLHLFTVDDLNHLHRGGRLSKMSAIVGGMLGIKPVLYFNNKGQLLPYTKIRGRRQSLDALADQMKKKYIQGENEEIFIFDADARADAEYLGGVIKKLMPDVKKIRYGNVGEVIGTHAGPNTIALFFIGTDREPIL